MIPGAMLPRSSILAALLLFSSACGPPAGNTVVALQLEHRVNGAALGAYVLETPFTNAFGNAFGVTRLLYFLSDVTVTPVGGSPVTLEGAHFVDHEDAARRRLELTLPPGAAVESVSFVMGLTAALNVTGAFPQAPESLMEWPMMMGGGYHNMKFEGRFVDRTGAIASFNAHSGCLNGVDYSFPVTLDARGLAVSGSAPALSVVMNLEQWFTTPDTWDLNEVFLPPKYGMMSEAAKQKSLMENGADAFSLEVAP